MPRPAIACLLLLLAAGAEAAPLKLSGSIRVRPEAVGGQVRPGFERTEMILAIRTTVLAELGDGPVKAAVELYDSRAYGVDGRSVVSTTDVNALEPVQAYVTAELVPAVRATAGRMMLNIGSRRLVAADDYRNTTNGYTGVRLDLGRKGRPEAVLIWTMPQERLPDDFEGVRRNRVVLDRESLDQRLWGGQLSLPVLPGGGALEASYYRLAERDSEARPTRDRRLDNVGVRLVREPAPGRLDHDVELIGQRGRASASLAPAAPRLDVRAWYLHAEIGRSFKGAWKPRLAFEFDHASGDDPGPDYRRFDTLFGMRRAELGPAGLYNVIGRANISAPGLRLEATPGRRTDGFVTWKLLWAASGTDSFSTTGVRDASGASGRFAGQQLDGRLRHWLLPGRVRAEANAALLFREGLLLNAPNAPPGRTMAYGSLALTGLF
jgi:hypothetical protein